MFETIVTPRKVITSDVAKSYPFKDPHLDLYDVKQGRQLIQTYKEYRKNCFLKGFKVSNLLQDETKSFDAFLSNIWSHFELDTFPNLALVAVGGFGRNEQFVESDIDLLIVSNEETISPEETSKIEQFVSFLWDLKIDLGTSVRTIKETVLASREDLTIITNLLETHFIAGAKDTYDELITVLENDDFWDDEKFFEAKIDEQNKRYHSFRDTVYSLEPDVKNSPGGLRDLHIMQWLAIKIYQAQCNADLCEVGLLTKSEYEEYLACRDFLWDVRFAVHCNSNSNILRLDFQKAVASLLGYGDEGNEPVESMMRDLFRIFNRERELNNIL